MRKALRAGWESHVSFASSVLVRCAVVAALAGLFATQNFAQNNLNPVEPSIANSAAAHSQNLLAPASLTETNLPAIAAEPTAVTTSQPATLKLSGATASGEAMPAEPSLVSNSLRSFHTKADSAQDQQTTNTPQSHKQGVRKGYLILGIAGAVIAGIGIIGYAEGAPKPGTVFFVPGAAMAGFGFYFAFHHRN